LVVILRFFFFFLSFLFCFRNDYSIRMQETVEHGLEVSGLLMAWGLHRQAKESFLGFLILSSDQRRSSWCWSRGQSKSGVSSSSCSWH
jgi:hypothetical protein